MYVNIDLHNAFHVTGLILYPLKTRGFLMFSGGIERKETSGIKWVKKLKLGRFPLGYWSIPAITPFQQQLFLPISTNFDKPG